MKCQRSIVLVYFFTCTIIFSSCGSEKVARIKIKHHCDLIGTDIYSVYYTSAQITDTILQDSPLEDVKINSPRRYSPLRYSFVAVVMGVAVPRLSARETIYNPSTDYLVNLVYFGTNAVILVKGTK